MVSVEGGWGSSRECDFVVFLGERLASVGAEAECMRSPSAVCWRAAKMTGLRGCRRRRGGRGRRERASGGRGRGEGGEGGRWLASARPIRVLCSTSAHHRTVSHSVNSVRAVPFRLHDRHARTETGKRCVPSAMCSARGSLTSVTSTCLRRRGRPNVHKICVTSSRLQALAASSSTTTICQDVTSLIIRVHFARCCCHWSHRAG